MDMDPSGGQHQQEMATHETLESMLECTKAQQQEKKARPQPEQALKCPRCDSSNTKFCYYNNYSLSQPRYFCKSCRRYWTKGGTLRNVPVGGGCRKNNKRSSPSSSSSSKKSQDQQLIITNQTHDHYSALGYDSNDLSLAFAGLHKQPIGQLGFDGHDLSMLGKQHNIAQYDVLGNYPTTSTAAAFLDAIRGGFVEAPNGFHDLCYGMGSNGNMVENGGGVSVNASDELGMAYSYENMNTGGATKMKQELCSGREGENRVLWGFPWQVGGDGNGNLGDLGPSWHGLLNSPLM